MLNKITKLNIGIFQNFQADQELKYFNRFNLFYGWNGSGKTTLSHFLYGLKEDKFFSSEFENVTFEVYLDETKKTEKDNLQLNNLNVFNEDFISEYIDWDKRVKKLLLISKEKIIDTDIFDEKSKIKKQKEDLLKKNDNDIEEISNDIDKKLQKKAKEIKTSFFQISPKDKTYFNYDKRKLKTFLDENKQVILSGKGLLLQNELHKTTNNIKPNEKNLIDLSYKELNTETLKNAENKIINLLKIDLSDGVLKKLKDNSDLSEWVENGLKIHRKYGENICQFCGNNIDQDYLDKLKKHFNDELDELRDKLVKAKEWVESKLIISEVALEKELFYPDEEREFLNAKNSFNNEISLLNNVFVNWKELLEEKYKNPAKEIALEKTIDDNFLGGYFEKKEELKSIIDKHNHRVKNFDEEYKNNQKKLELHYATEFNKDLGYFKKIKDVNKISEDNKIIKKEVEILEKELFDLNKSLSSEVLGESEFNTNLAKFLGHDEIELRFDEKLKGYKIIRKHHNRVQAKKLSEGERTAIAFIYFITKLKEKKTLKDEIIVLDDPISSLDSNNLFSAYSFIKSELENSGQLFVFTHNFTFFKLIRDWLKTKNKKKNNRDIVKSHFYQIEIVPESPRYSEIKNIDSTLLDYNSEYHYVFKKLFDFREEESLNLEKAFQVANLGRKLLESFLGFKFPKKRNDLRALLNEAVPDSQKQEKIYRFIQKYSHLPFNDFDNSEDNLSGESGNITSDILNIVKELDSQHYDEMKNICNNN